jgi:hypothetical protein
MPLPYTSLHSDNQVHSNYILYFSTMRILAKLPTHDESVVIALVTTAFSLSTLLEFYSDFSSAHTQLSRPMEIH